MRYVGDAVAFVVAETAAAAREAADSVSVTYEVLNPVVDLEEAIAPGAPLLFDDVPNSLCCDRLIGDAGATEAGFARAAHVARIRLVNDRLVNNPMELPAAIAEYEPATGARHSGRRASSRMWCGYCWGCSS